MTSILTNTSAMTALQTLKNINSNLETTQSQISTGKKVGSAKDNAAIFAISRVMEADVTAFKSISESLSLSESTVATASNGAKQIGNLLNEIQGKVVTAQDDSVDRGKINSEIQELIGQVENIVASSQFNGVNLLDGSKDGADGFETLASLNRAADGSVTPDNISFDPTNSNLSTSAGATALNVAGGEVNATVGGSLDVEDRTAGAAATLNPVAGTDLQRTTVTNGEALAIGDFDFQLAGANTGGAEALARGDAFDLSSNQGIVAGDTLNLTVAGNSVSYTVQAGDSGEDIATGVRDGLIADGIGSDIDISFDPNGLVITNNTGGDIGVDIGFERSAGGLAALSTMSVATEVDAATALDNIEDLIQTATNAEAQLGTISQRLEIQNDFVSSQIDSFKAGVGTLVDADMEAASARLQALQTQQQLGIQALSIANSSSQNILSLFR